MERRAGGRATEAVAVRLARYCGFWRFAGWFAVLRAALVSVSTLGGCGTGNIHVFAWVVPGAEHAACLCANVDVVLMAKSR
jgi:hypothetical protein